MRINVGRSCSAQALIHIFHRSSYDNYGYSACTEGESSFFGGIVAGSTSSGEARVGYGSGNAEHGTHDRLLAGRNGPFSRRLRGGAGVRVPLRAVRARIPGAAW